MKPKEYVYEGEPVPDLKEAKYAEFLVQLEKSILFSLEKRNLLNHSQVERCVMEIEKRAAKESSKHRA